MAKALKIKSLRCCSYEYYDSEEEKAAEAEAKKARLAAARAKRAARRHRAHTHVHPVEGAVGLLFPDKVHCHKMVTDSNTQQERQQALIDLQTEVRALTELAHEATDAVTYPFIDQSRELREQVIRRAYLMIAGKLITLKTLGSVFPDQLILATLHLARHFSLPPEQE